MSELLGRRLLEGGRAHALRVDRDDVPHQAPLARGVHALHDEQQRPVGPGGRLGVEPLEQVGQLGVTGLERRLAVVLVALEGRRGGRVDVDEREALADPQGVGEAAEACAVVTDLVARLGDLGRLGGRLLLPLARRVLVLLLLVLLALAHGGHPAGPHQPDRGSALRVLRGGILTRCACSSRGPPPSPPPPTSTPSATRHCMPPTPLRRQPWLRANMVTTLDGSATGADGRSGGINTEADHVVFELLRAQSHAVVVGAGTLRDEGYSSLSVDERWRGLRQGDGLPPHPAPRRRQQPRARATRARRGRRRHGPARDRGLGSRPRRRPVEPRRAARHRLR